MLIKEATSRYRAARRTSTSSAQRRLSGYAAEPTFSSRESRRCTRLRHQLDLAIEQQKNGRAVFKGHVACDFPPRRNCIGPSVVAYRILLQVHAHARNTSSPWTSHLLSTQHRPKASAHRLVAAALHAFRLAPGHALPQLALLPESRPPKRLPPAPGIANPNPMHSRRGDSTFRAQKECRSQP